ncbi:MAG: Gfo/Idh/MocA family oxidoreductase [Candidatus Bathyarchaeota archaeon]|nr:Gfo/Idh/MocA family oxidoreductase [Candidatus Bathyarchaeota archaeon]
MSGEKVGFVTMGEVKPKAEEIPEMGVGMLGYAFMGKAHSNAFKKISYMFCPPPAIPKLVAICGRNELKVAEAAKRYGYSKYYTEWRKLVNDPEVELFDNGAPNNLHAEPCIEAAENGKHILCEKPLARTAEEAKPMVESVRKARVKHMVGFNYRFVPAMQVAKKLIDDGVIGRIYHFHGRYLQEWIMDPNFPRVWRLVKDSAGTGAIGDLGAHVVDLAHFLVGDIISVSALTSTFIKERPLPEDESKKGKVDVDDAFESIIEFDSGAIGHISTSRFCGGRKNYQDIEIYGEHGSISFNLERLNELKVHTRNHDIKDLESSFHETLVTEAYHPYWENWWPHGHIIGWEHTTIHEIYHLMDAIINEKDIQPVGATFEDGYRCNVVLDAVVKSVNTGKKIQVNYSL